MNGITLTTAHSLVSVTFDGQLLVVDFPYNPKMVQAIKKIHGAQWNKRYKKKWTLPKSKESIDALKTTLKDNIFFKSPEAWQRDIAHFKETEETLMDVLERTPSHIDTTHLNHSLKNFQKTMIGWAVTPKGKMVHLLGGILGDTMGLGKTFQGLAFSSYLKYHPPAHMKRPVKHVLIVCPKTLKVNWLKETQKFTNESVLIIDGNKEERAALYRRVRDENIFYTIINYDLLRQKEKIGTTEVRKGKKTTKKTVFGDFIDIKLINEIDYDVILIDEAQRMRNPFSDTSLAIHQIQTPHVRLLMTGTPIEKDLQNLFPLVDYISPNILSSASLPYEERLRLFEDRYLIMTWDAYALKASYGKIKPEFRKPVGVKNLSILNQKLAPFHLKREAKDVLGEMPEARGADDYIAVDWSHDQKEVYNVLLQAHERCLKDLHEVENEEQKEKLENKKNTLVMYMRETANTPELLFRSLSPLAHHYLSDIPKFRTSSKEFTTLLYERLAVIERMSVTRKKAQSINQSTLSKKEKQDAVTPLKNALATDEERLKSILKTRETKLNRYHMRTPKLDHIISLVSHLVLEKQEKVVIFSEFEQMTAILRREIQKEFTLKKHDASIVMYTGKEEDSCEWLTNNAKEIACNQCPFQTRCASRQKSQWYFQHDDQTKVIILTDAGKEGVNLQQGSHLINTDLPASYSIYAQRNGRVRRLNSPHASVMIHNVVTLNSFEESRFRTLMEQKEIQDRALHYSDAAKKALEETTNRLNQEKK